MTKAGQKDELSGRRAIVTGAGRGIGRAIAEDLARAGAAVTLVSRSDNVVRAARQISEGGWKAEPQVGSVADERFVQGVVESVERSGGADILVNAAAILGPIGRFAECDMSAFAETVATDLLGTCFFMRWVLPGMERRRFGRIINFAGGGAAYAYPRFSAYGASKTAVVRLTETVAAETDTPNVTINVIAPGAVATDLLETVRNSGGEVRTTTAIGEPLRLVRFLSSSNASHITGRFIHVRDSYELASLFEDKAMLTLRRVEMR